jgi:hypothetical protein
VAGLGALLKGVAMDGHFRWIRRGDVLLLGEVFSAGLGICRGLDAGWHSWNVIDFSWGEFSRSWLTSVTYFERC